MATASQQQHQQHPPPSQTPSHEHSHTASETDPWDGDNGDRMFNIYIWDYCNKRGYKKTCQDLQEEAKLGNEFHPPIDAKQGLLYEWWSVFWVLFGAKNSGTGPDEAILYVQNQQNQHQQMLRNQAMHTQNVARYHNPNTAMNGIMPTNPQAGPPQALANGPTPGLGRGMPPTPGAGPAGGPSQTPMQPPHGMVAPPMPNGITPGHGGPHPQPPMGQPHQPGPGPNGTSQQPSQQNPQGQPSPHNSQQPQPQQQQQHPPQPPPMQHGQTPLGFPGPMPGPGAQQGQAPNQPNGIMGGPHHMPGGHPGMNMAQRGSMGNMGLGGVGRGAGGPPPGFQSPTMAHANPNAPPPPPGQQHPVNMPPPFQGMPASGMGGQMPGMRPGMFPPSQHNGAGPTTPGATNAGTPGPAPGGPPGANQQFGMPGGSRAATPASAGGAGGVAGSALSQRSPSMAAAAVGRGAGPIPGNAGTSAAGAGVGRGRGAKRNSVSPGDEPLADPQGNKIEGSPPDRKKPRHSPNSEGAGPQAGPSGTNTAIAGTPQQPPQVPAGGFPPGMRAPPGAPGFSYGMPQGMAPAATQQLINMQQFKPGMQRAGMPGSPSAAAGGSSGPPQQNKPGMSSMMPPPSPLTANMKPGSSTGTQPPVKVEGNTVKAEGSPRGGLQGGPSQVGNTGPGIGHSPATPAPAAPSPGHTAPASRPGTASSNHVMTSNAPTPTATQQPPPPPQSSGPPQSASSVMGASGNGSNGNNANSGVNFDMDFTSNLGIAGMGGMEDFTAMFRDDFERDFGAWFTTGGSGDDMLDPMR